MKIVDCDAHVLEPADLWQTYLEPEFRDRAIRIEEHDGVEKLIIGEQVVLEGVVAGLGGAEADKATGRPRRLNPVNHCPRGIPGVA